MIKKLIIPIVFALVGTSFVTYSFLDTFVIEKKYDTSVVDADDAVSTFSFSFAEMSEEEEEEEEDSSEVPQESLSSIEEHSESKSSQKSQSENSSNSSKESSEQGSEESSSNTSSSSSSSSSQSSSSSSSSISDVNISTNQYYENLTKTQISALFTKEKVFIPKQHYSDSNIYIDITKGRFEDYTDYYVADIRIKSLKYLKTALAQNTYGENVTEKTSEICNRQKGVLAIDGDTYGSQRNGYVLRNGTTYRDVKNTTRKKPEDLVVYSDGTFEVFNENNYTLNQIIENAASKNLGVWQVFSFGPGLVSEGAKIIQKGEEVGTAQGQNRNQRCAIGMVAPLHYVFVVSEGRTTNNPGLSLYQMGKITCEILHCYCAYNLDGGGSATMYLDDGTGNANNQGAIINEESYGLTSTIRTPGEREISDIVYIG